MSCELVLLRSVSPHGQMRIQTVGVAAAQSKASAIGIKSGRAHGELELAYLFMLFQPMINKKYKQKVDPNYCSWDKASLPPLIWYPLSNNVSVGKSSLYFLCFSIVAAPQADGINYLSKGPTKVLRRKALLSLLARTYSASSVWPNKLASFSG